MKYELNDKVAIVTGGAMGLGKEIVVNLCNRGAKVVFCDIAENEGTELANTLTQEGKSVDFVQCDVADYNQVEKMFEFTIKKYNRIDVLVNNAAKQTISSIDDMEYEEFKSVVDVNLNGAFYCIKNAVKHMKERSVILNILSIYWSHRARVNKYHYDAAKAGLGSLTRNLSIELAKKGITINGIYPGFLMTPMNEDIKGDQLEESLKKNRINGTDVSDPKGFAEYAMSFVENFSYGTTGHVLGVDGGRSIV